VATLGTKKYSKPAGYTVVERQALQPDWGAVDLTEGTQITGGTYNGKYIWQVIAFAGIFWSVKDSGYTGGGKRPPFISGGVAGDVMRNLQGEFGAHGFLVVDGNNSPLATGMVKRGHNWFAQTEAHYEDPSGFTFAIDASLIVPVGSQNSPVTASSVLWRRTG
jgi:hypothetical protein